MEKVKHSMIKGRREMNILVTGGAGFIGSNIVDGLINKGDQTSCGIDRIRDAGRTQGCDKSRIGASGQD